jgi:myo-inositol-1(or 4)-monophosphatase
MNIAYSANTNLIITAIRKAGKHLLRDYHELEYLQSSTKGPNQFAQMSVQKLEERLIQELSTNKACGLTIGDRVIVPHESLRWVVKPLSGYNNFIHAIEQFSVVVELQKLDGGKPESIAVVIDSPIIGKLYWAEKGRGAWSERYNNQSEKMRLRVSTRKPDSPQLMIVSNYYNASEKLQQQLLALATYGGKIVICECPYIALAYVASGKYDIYVHYNNAAELSLSDLLVREAGGVSSAVDEQISIFSNFSL